MTKKDIFKDVYNDFFGIDKLSKENPNYDIIRDNDVSPSDEQKKYDIKRSDISGLNMKSISDTLDVKQSLNDYLNF